MKTYFKHIEQGEKFTHAGVEYTRTNFMRGKRYEAGKLVFRKFTQKSVVENAESPNALNAWRQAK